MAKVFGWILLACAGLAIIGGMANGTCDNMSDMSFAELIGYLAAMAGLIFGGLVLITKDGK